MQQLGEVETGDFVGEFDLLGLPQAIGCGGLKLGRELQWQDQTLTKVELAGEVDVTLVGGIPVVRFGGRDDFVESLGALAVALRIQE